MSRAHHLNVKFIKDCYYHLDRNKAVGVDRVSWTEFSLSTLNSSEIFFDSPSFFKVTLNFSIYKIVKGTLMNGYISLEFNFVIHRFYLVVFCAIVIVDIGIRPLLI